MILFWKITMMMHLYVHNESSRPVNTSGGVMKVEMVNLLPVLFVQILTGLLGLVLWQMMASILSDGGCEGWVFLSALQ